MRKTTLINWHIIVLVIAWAVIHTLLFRYYGVRDLFDASGYVRGADFLIEHGRFEDIHHVFYAVPVCLLAFFRLIFPQQLLPFLIFQSILSGLATLSIYRTGATAFNDTRAGFLSGILFLVWWDNIQWNTVTMTESLFCTFTCFLLYLLVHFEGKRSQYYLTFGLMAFILFIRPTSIVILLGAIAFFFQYEWSRRVPTVLEKISTIVLGLVIAGSGATLMFTQWDFTDQYKRGNIVTYMDTLEGAKLYEDGLRIDTEELDLPPGDLPVIQKMVYFFIHNPVHFVYAGLVKIWFLLMAIRPYYSPAHNSYLVIWMTGIYFLSYFGWRKLRASQAKIFVISVILVNCLLIGISTVDWDNRFYIPMEPGIVILAGGGGIVLLDWIRNQVGIRIDDK